MINLSPNHGSSLPNDLNDLQTRFRFKVPGRQNDQAMARRAVREGSAKAIFALRQMAGMSKMSKFE